MIVDFRMRPPYKSFLGINMYHPVCNSALPMNLRGSYIPSAHEKSLDLFWKEMDEAGISKGVMMARSVGANGSVPNEEIREMAELFPDRAIPFGGVDVCSGISAAVKEVQKCHDYGFKGIAVEPGWNTPARMPDDAYFFPIYAMCEQMNLPVVLTVSHMQGPNLEYSNPTHIQNIANAFPDLQIVVAHACYPWIPQIFNVALLCKNVWLLPDLYMLNPYTPGREMYLNGCRWLNCERVIFGSAYPCYELKAAVDDVRDLGFTEAELEKIYCGNARKLLAMTTGTVI